MTRSANYADLSGGIITTAITKERLPEADAQRAAVEVYREFSGDAPIQQYIMEFAAQARGILDKNASALNLMALRNFDYLFRESIDEQSIRIKGIIAVNMVETELYDNDLSAHLVEPFVGRVILPNLYASWKAKL